MKNLIKLKHLLRNNNSTLNKKINKNFEDNPLNQIEQREKEVKTQGEYLLKKMNEKKTCNKYDHKELYFGREAREVLRQGVDLISESVKKTFGPLGKNFIIENYQGEPIVTKDGVTVARYIKSTNRKERIGLKLLNLIAGNTNIHAGDGTTTSTILSSFLIKRGLFLIDAGYDTVDLIEGINISTEIMQIILKSIRLKTKDEHLINLAMITTLNDAKISKLCVETVKHSSLEGQILIEQGYSEDSELIKTNSYNVSHGVANKIILGNVEELSLNDPLVLVFEDELNNQALTTKILDFCDVINRNCVVFSSRNSKSVVSQVAKHNSNSLNKVLLVNIPDYAQNNYNLEKLSDISVVTGAILISKFSPIKSNVYKKSENQKTIEMLNDIAKKTDINTNESEKIHFDENLDIPEEYYGGAQIITCSDLETIIVSPKGDKSEILEHIKTINNLIIKNEKVDFQENIDNQKLRALNLKQNTSLILVGGGTDVEKNNSRDKIIDCINSLKTALEEGLLLGGGNGYLLALYIFSQLENKKCSNIKFDEDIQMNKLLAKLNNKKSKSFELGIEVLKNSFIDLIHELYKNNSYSSSRIIDEYFKQIENIDNPLLFGFDLKSNSFSLNLLEKGIVDSYITIKTSIEDSIKLSTLLLNTECVILNKYDYEPSSFEVFRKKYSDDYEFREKARQQYIKNDEEGEDFTKGKEIDLSKFSLNKNV